MIYTHIQGGLGNQMFQYAHARFLSEKYGIPFALDTWNYDPRSNSIDIELHRKYGLDKFNITGRVATQEEVAPLKRLRPRRGRRHSIYNFLRADASRYIEDMGFVVKDEYLSPKALSQKKDIYLSGFWQSEQFFEPIRSIIKKEFTFKATPNESNSKMLAKIDAAEAVCVHIRRGNFLIPKYRQVHGIVPAEYYRDAFAHIQTRVNNPTYFVFSDDIEWVENAGIIPKPFEVVNVNTSDTDYEDLRLMSHCKHFINANSSFSWWGAWLSERSPKIVIIPDKILMKDINIDCFAPKEWVRINTTLK